MAGLETLAEGAGKLLGAVPELYDDLAKSTVQEAGKLLSLPLEAVNALLVRPRCWIANANYKIQETNALIANKLKFIDENKLIPPPDYVAVPALQALTYSMDSDELRELYATLLAKAMNTDTSGAVHPAYIEIIKQFSPLDAKLYKHIVINLVQNDEITLFNINFKSNGHTVKKFSNIIEYQDAFLSDIAQSVDNFIRCGLFAVTQYAVVMLEDGEKEEVMQWRNVQEEYSDGLEMDLEMCTPAHITELGKNFYSICCKDEF